jgi:cyanophycin synthetase
LDISVEFAKLKTGQLEISYKEDDFLKVHTYETPLDFFISSDSLVALIVACRPKAITSAAFSFPVSKNAIFLLNRDFKITVESESIEENIVFGAAPSMGALPSRSNRYLSFSGGVDSLAARYLIGQDAGLISIDYGENFRRESEFFTKWQPIVVKTDFRSKPFNESIDWRFMSSGALLLSDYLGIETVMFGTILEAAPFWFNTIYRSVFEETKHYQSFALARVNSGQAVTALSEYGTTKVAYCYGDEILTASIKSAANDNTSKKLRKLLLGKIVTGETITEDWIKENSTEIIPKSGSSFAGDILGLYFAWKVGADLTDRYILRMDEDFSKFAETADMGFFEKYNQFNLSSTPSDLKRKFVGIYENIGILPYDESDISALQAVRGFLADRFRFKA